MMLNRNFVSAATSRKKPGSKFSAIRHSNPLTARFQIRAAHYNSSESLAFTTTWPCAIPVISKSCFIDRPPFHWAELALGITDGHQRISKNVLRYSQQGFDLSLATHVIGCYQSA